LDSEIVVELNQTEKGAENIIAKQTKKS
jgi:hypothetical protein